MLLVTQVQIGAMIGGIGQAVHTVVPGTSPQLARLVSAFSPSAGRALAARPELPWALVITIVTALMLVSGSYRLVERATTVMVVAFTFMTVLCVIFLPSRHAIHWESISLGLSFRLPPEAMGAAFAMFGITGVGANELLAYPYWCIEKGYARYTGARDETTGWVERARGWLRVMKLDAWVSMMIYTISTLAFYLLGASVLHEHTAGKGLPATVGELLDTLARMYQPVLGATVSKWFLVIGSFAVLYSTLFAATAGTSRLLADFLRVNRFIDPERDDLRMRWVRIFCMVLPLLGFGLFVSMANPVRMVMIGGKMQAISLPLIASAAVFLRDRRTDQRIKPGRVWDVFLWLSMFGLILAATYSLIPSRKEPEKVDSTPRAAVSTKGGLTRPAIDNGRPSS